MKNFFCSLFIVLFALPGLLPARASNMDTVGDEKTATVFWKVATLAPKGIGYSQRFAEVLMPAIEEETKGNLAFKVYWGGSMGDDVQILQKMRLGQLDGAGLSGQGTFMMASEIPILGLPFLFEDYGEVDHIKEMMIEEFDAIALRQGFKLLLWLDQDFDQIYSRSQPMDKMENFRRVRFVTWFGPLEGRMLERMGASPIPINVAEIPSAMRSGMADAMIAPAIWIIGTQLYTRARYVNPVRIRYVPAFVVVTAKAFEAVPEQHRQVLSQRRLSLAHDFCVLARQDSEKSLVAMIAYGVKEASPCENELARMKAAVRPVWDDLSGDLYPQSLLDKLVAHLEDFRAQKDQAAGECPQALLE
ncbi:MAG: TRAP transporter substrate-binding protein DctP [Desulfatibacillaceae bacterium]|nr:TRAP transporter substrate-binding protein DctP [Desulfatibacillaceae bacterium]